MSLWRGLNVAGLVSGLIGAKVFDGDLSGVWRLVLFGGLALLDLVMIVWLTRGSASSLIDLPESSPQPKVAAEDAGTVTDVSSTEEISSTQRAA